MPTPEPSTDTAAERARGVLSGTHVRLRELRDDDEPLAQTFRRSTPSCGGRFHDQVVTAARESPRGRRRTAAADDTLTDSGCLFDRF